MSQQGGQTHANVARNNVVALNCCNRLAGALGIFKTYIFLFHFMLQLELVLIAVFAVVEYRAAVYAVLAAQHNYNMGAVSIATSGTAALINLIIIMLLNKVLEFPCICPFVVK